MGAYFVITNLKKKIA